MCNNGYNPVTPNDIAILMNFYTDFEENTAYEMAEEMLSGITRFNAKELRKIASYKGVSVEDLTELDPSFACYKNPVAEVRKDIAKRLVANGFSVEFAADITGIRHTKVLNIK